jgi:hypothetical protein
VAPFANQTFGVSAITSEQDTNTFTWKMVEVLSSCKEVAGAGDAAVKQERRGTISGTRGPEYVMRPHGVDADRS